MRRELSIVMAVACGDGALPPATSDDPEPASPPSLAPELQHQPTYHRDVAPILARRCAGCHVDGGTGPFALTTYEEASMLSAAIAEATTDRAMPPWPADGSGACGSFVDARWLAPHEITTLSMWHAGGAPLGDPADAIAQLAPPAMPFVATIELASSAAYQVRPGPDEYRCFVVDPGLAIDRFITATEIRIDRADVVHHMQLFAADSASDEVAIDAREAEDPEPGYACGSEGVGPLRYIGVWGGGDAIWRWPDGAGTRLAANHRLVVQLHYHNHGSQPVLDRTAVALELADSVAQVGTIASARVFGFQLAPGLPTVEIATEQAQVADRQIRGARIHMHELGASARMELVRGNTTTCVLDIPRWDAGWQLFYRFAAPIDVAAGDRLRVRCRYDTTSQSATVSDGQGTGDEMCIGYTFLTE